MSNITKIFRPSTDDGQLAMAQVHANNYNSSLEHIISLASVLQEDFPEIKQSDIKVHKYGGPRVKGVTFVEVQLGKRKDTPEGYFEVSDIESIL